MLGTNGDSTWIFDVSSKKNLVSRLFTAMTGSVVTSGKISSGGRGGGKKRSSDDTNKENISTNKRSRGGAAKGKAKAKAAAMPSIPDESDITVSTVSCEVGVRTKLWLDDLLKCCEHVSEQVCRLFGSGDSSTKKSLKAHLISQGLMFAFKSQIMLETNKGPKQYKKWSSLRVALKDHAICIQLKDGHDTCKSFVYCILFKVYVFVCSCLAVLVLHYFFECQMN